LAGPRRRLPLRHLPVPNLLLPGSPHVHPAGRPQRPFRLLFRQIPKSRSRPNNPKPKTQNPKPLLVGWVLHCGHCPLSLYPLLLPHRHSYGEPALWSLAGHQLAAGQGAGEGHALGRHSVGCRCSVLALAPHCLPTGLELAFHQPALRAPLCGTRSIPPVQSGTHGRDAVHLVPTPELRRHLHRWCLAEKPLRTQIPRCLVASLPRCLYSIAFSPS
jgi:hypothetical protein